MTMRPPRFITGYGQEAAEVQIPPKVVPFPLQTQAEWRPPLSHEDEPEQPDPINPDYYKQGGVELIDVIENLPHNRATAMKYLYRAGDKNPDTLLKDLNKALWYVQREIQRVTKQGENQ